MMRVRLPSCNYSHIMTLCENSFLDACPWITYQLQYLCLMKLGITFKLRSDEMLWFFSLCSTVTFKLNCNNCYFLRGLQFSDFLKTNLIPILEACNFLFENYNSSLTTENVWSSNVPRIGFGLSIADERYSCSSLSPASFLYPFAFSSLLKLKMCSGANFL